MKKLFFLIVGALLLSGCKPTEKGYKSAYDAALNKRQESLADIDVKLPEGALQEFDGMELKEINGTKVYVTNQRLKPAVENFKLPGSYNVAVGAYKMITNCKAQSEVLKEEGFEAFPAENSEGMFYTIVGSFQKLEEAVATYEKYQKGKNRVYVGLHGAPVIIYSPVTL
ncbi:MAG: membrane lipoprotein lipid attachment site-containing protein [Muribaculaceae bacterium]|nr:membrane lipoprotein lipid attachment site-containing protein [Muribaculaceae bacterium]